MYRGLKAFGGFDVYPFDEDNAELQELPLIAAVALIAVAFVDTVMRQRTSAVPPADQQAASANCGRAPRKTGEEQMAHARRDPSGHGLRSGSMWYRRSDGISQTAHAGHVVVLDAAGTRYYGLDQVGVRIWDLLGRAVTAEEIVERIASDYDAPREDVQVDVHAFLRQLVDARLIAMETCP